MTFDLEDFIVPADTVSKPEMMFVFGNYGSGKTSFCLSASLVPELAPVLYFDLEGSTTGVSRNYPKDKVSIVRVDKQAQGDQIRGFKFMNQALEAVLEGKYPRFKTVVIDPLSTWNDWALAYYKAKEEADAAKTGRNASNYEQWTGAANYLTRSGGMFDRLKSAEPLVLGTLHTKQGDEVNPVAADFVWPGTTARASLGQRPDVILALSMKADRKTGEKNVQAVTTSTRGENAKNRYNLPIQVDNVDMPLIWSMCVDPKAIDDYNESKKKIN